MEDGSAATPGNAGTPLRVNIPLRAGGTSTAASTVVLRRPGTSRQSTAQLSEHRSAASPAPSATSPHPPTRAPQLSACLELLKRCPKKHRPYRTRQRTYDTTWPFLKRAMTIAVLRRPSGVSVLRDLQAVNAVKKAVCPHGSLIYPNWDQVENRIRNSCANGPSASTYFE